MISIGKTLLTLQKYLSKHLLFEDRKFSQMPSIDQLSRPQNKLEPVEGVIENISEPRTVNLKTGGQAQVADATLKDETGQIKLSLWDAQIKMVKKGSKVRIENGYISTFRGENALNVGKFGKLVVLEF
jgi:replication factor A1